VFFITDDGCLISNYHVVKDATKVRLLTGAGLIDAKVVRVDAANDLALLKADGRFAPLPIAASRPVALGGTVATVGFPDIGLQGFQRANRNWFAAVHGHDYLPPVFVPPFLVAARLGDAHEAVPAQNFDHFIGVADWKPPAYGMASSISFEPLCNLTGDGSNQSASASLALAMASASVSPAEAQPGSSGKTADQRLDSESNSIKRRSFMPER
jgi:hypothetical protein